MGLIALVAIHWLTPDLSNATCHSGTSPYANSKVDYVVDGKVVAVTKSDSTGHWAVCY